MKKYSKLLGEVEVITYNDTITTVRVLKTGEIKKLINSFANLQDEPFVEEVKSARPKMRELNQEEKNHLSYINRNGSALLEELRKSNANYRNGKSGLSKF